MVNLKSWLREQGVSVRELAAQLDLPRKTVEDWVYRGAVPSSHNNERLNEFIGAECTHHWVIDRPNGPLSDGVCLRCGERRGFTNSAEFTPTWPASHRPKASSITKE